MRLVADVAGALGKSDLTGLEQLQALMASGQRTGIAESLDFALTEVDMGLAVFEGSPGPHACNPIGMVHGGYAATPLDSACGCAVHLRLTADRSYTALELKVAYRATIQPRR